MSDRARLGPLIEGCLGRLKAFVAKRASPSEAEDVVQEAIANLVAADSLLQVDQVSAWLFRAARNEIIDRGRKKKEAALPGWDELDPELLELSEAMCAPPEDPEAALLRALLWEEMAAAIDALPEPQREVFVLTELDGLPVKEISLRTGASQSALLTRKRRAVLSLRKRLRGVYRQIMAP
jgi:RNA polymerase sigma factor (sigma-70 family)